MVFQEIPTSDFPISTRLEVATSSRPRQLVVTNLKQREKEHAGEVYKSSKRDSAQSHNINWKSPTFWPMINKAVMEQVGKPNLSQIIRTLRSRDQRFEHLTHQRLSDWRDKGQEDKIVWSEKTLQEVKKGFLPGGNLTRQNVFVSFIYNSCRSTTDNV
jgi:hypothetical protein